MSRRLAATMVAIVTLASACGGGDDTAAPEETGTEASETVEAAETQPGALDEETISAAVLATSQLESARYRFVSDETAGGTAVTLDGEGIVTFDDRPATLDLDVSELLQATGLPPLGGNFEAIFADGVTYVNAGIFREIFPDIKANWLRLDPATMPPAEASATLAGIEQIAGYDPAIGLHLLSGVDPDTVSETGTSDVAGEPTVTYSATTNLEEALAETDPEFRQRMLDRVGADTLDMTFELDGDNVLRRVTYSEPSATGGTNMTIDYVEFGVDAEIPLPAPDEVTDLLDAVPLF